MSIDLHNITEARRLMPCLLADGRMRPMAQQSKGRMLWNVVRFLRHLWLAGNNIPFGIASVTKDLRVGDNHLDKGDWILFVDGGSGWDGASYYAFSLGLPYLGTFKALDGIEQRYPHERAYEKLVIKNKS